MKINLTKILKGTKPFLDSSKRVLSAANNAKNGEFGKSWNDLETIYKSGDLKRMKNTIKGAKKLKKDVKKKGIIKSIQDKKEKILDDEAVERVNKRRRLDDNMQQYVPSKPPEESFDLLGMDDYL